MYELNKENYFSKVKNLSVRLGSDILDIYILGQEQGWSTCQEALKLSGYDIDIKVILDKYWKNLEEKDKASVPIDL